MDIFMTPIPCIERMSGS